MMPTAARPMPPPPELNGTLRYYLRLNAGGGAIALKLSNEPGTEPLLIDHVTVAAASAPTALQPVKFGDAPAISVPAGAPLVSDPVPLAVAGGDWIVVNLHLAKPYVATQFQPANRTEYFAGADTAADPAAVGAPVSVRPIVSAVFVSNPTPKRAVVAFGDSITDGTAGKLPFTRGWPDVLADRLRAARGRAAPAVVNAGISGNRLDVSTRWGASALARLDRDALALPNVDTLVLLEGINDIDNLADPPDAPAVTADRVIAAYRQIVARAHQRGVKVIGATLTPFAGAFAYSDAREAVRKEVNAWIRTAHAFDAVIDFEAATRDPARPDRLLPDYDSGDHLHPSDAGYRAMGQAIDLNLFR
jgi:lysophospholipase L1-like esterase